MGMIAAVGRQWRLVALAGAALATTAIVVAVGHTSSSDRQSATAPPAKARLEEGRRHIASKLMASFHVLRDAHEASGSASPPLPPQAIRDFTATPASQYGADPALARYVVSGAVGAWIVPGANGLCIYSDTGGGCSSVTGAEKGSLREVVISSDGKETLVGVAPDGNSSVLVTDASKVTHTVAVVDNLYVASDLKPVSVLVRDSSGNEHSLETR